MTQHDFDRFSAIMLGIAENYGQSLSPTGISIRFKALASHAVNEVERAAMSLLVCRKYTTMPTIADFLEHMNGGSAEDKAEVEAGKVLWAIGRHGVYASVVFDDAVTQAVIVLGYGGWVKLCSECGPGCERGESEKWFRKDFSRTWAAYSRQGVQHTGHLPGLFEITNCSNGYHSHVDAPKLVGDPAKAQAVLESGKDTVLGCNAVTMRGETRSIGSLLHAMQGGGNKAINQ